MMDSVKAYKQRRAVRMKARMDANEDKGRWVTTENDHKIHFNESGEPDKGNPHVIAAMKGGKAGGASGGGVPKKIRGMDVVGSSEDGDFVITYSKFDLGSKYRVMSRFRAEDGSSSYAKPVPFNTIGEANNYLKKLEDSQKKIKGNYTPSDFQKDLNARKKYSSEKALAEQEVKEARAFRASMHGKNEESLKKEMNSGDSDKAERAAHDLERLQDRKKKYGNDFGVAAAEKKLADAEKKYNEVGKKIDEVEKQRKLGKYSENKEYSYGSIEGHQPMEKGKASENESSGSYEKLPFYLRSKKDLDPADRKKVQSTVSRFMKEAKEGDVYECGGGFGSAGGQRFRVTRRRGKLALQWINDGYSQPVQMSRGNVEEFIRNGAKLVK